MLKPRAYTCETCRDGGNEQVVVGHTRSGIPIYVETDIPCRACARRVRRWMREARELVEQADRFLAIPKGW